MARLHHRSAYAGRQGREQEEDSAVLIEAVLKMIFCWTAAAASEINDLRVPDSFG
jgi:hypothetical protein